MGNLGKIAEAQINHTERPKFGNYLYGAFGRDFLTKEGRHHHDRRAHEQQWKALCDATALHASFEMVEKHLGVNLEGRAH